VAISSTAAVMRVASRNIGTTRVRRGAGGPAGVPSEDGGGGCGTWTG
jgi:hypothetical protein